MHKIFLPCLLALVISLVWLAPTTSFFNDELCLKCGVERKIVGQSKLGLTYRSQTKFRERGDIECHHRWLSTDSVSETAFLGQIIDKRAIYTTAVNRLDP
jgi:hypothetical protein